MWLLSTTPLPKPPSIVTASPPPSSKMTSEAAHGTISGPTPTVGAIPHDLLLRWELVVGGAQVLGCFEKVLAL